MIILKIQHSKHFQSKRLKVVINTLGSYLNLPFNDYITKLWVDNNTNNFVLRQWENHESQSKMFNSLSHYN